MTDVLTGVEVSALRAATRDVLAKECTPELVRHTMTGGDQWQNLWRIVVDLGWPALAVPAHLGGLGLGLDVLTAVSEELGYAVCPAPVLTSFVAGSILADGGRERDVDATLSGARHKLAKSVIGGAVVGLALAEPGPVRNGDGPGRVFVVEGSRSTIVLAAKTEQVMAHDCDAALKWQPVTAFDAGRPIEALPALPGLGSAVGGDAGGLVHTARLLVAAELVGLGRRALDLAVTHSCARTQFGSAIGEFQAVKHRLVDVHCALSSAHGLVMCASATPTPMATAMAKASASAAAVSAVRAAVQVSGALGITAEHELPWILRRVRQASELWGGARAHYAEIGRAMRDGART